MPRPDEQTQRYWQNTVGNAFEPLNFTEPSANPAERTAWAAEYSAHCLGEINEKLGALLDVLRQRADES